MVDNHFSKQFKKHGIFMKTNFALKNIKTLFRTVFKNIFLFVKKEEDIFNNKKLFSIVYY